MNQARGRHELGKALGLCHTTVLRLQKRGVFVPLFQEINTMQKTIVFDIDECKERYAKHREQYEAQYRG